MFLTRPVFIEFVEAGRASPNRGLNPLLRKAITLPEALSGIWLTANRDLLRNILGSFFWPAAAGDLESMAKKPARLIAIIGPGILVAATGVGAGDLATASFTGSMLGLAVLWAVLLGAALKYVLNEGLARWQLATGTTLLQGCVDHLGRPVQWLFLVYLVVWSFLVGAMLMSAVGVTSHAVYSPLGNAVADKIFYGILHSLAALCLIRLGGYRLFQKVMGVCIALMFAVVVTTAIALQPDVGDLLTGLLWPTIPQTAGSVTWTVALIGGVGGTVTILCYGYWIREEGRHDLKELNTCRIDLATGYGMTALFGIAMVIIGSTLGPMSGGGASLIVKIAQDLENALGDFGPACKWAFLLGAWGAVFSSLLGVWQSVPYLFADFWSLRQNVETPERGPIDTSSFPYQSYLFGIAILPILGLAAMDFRTITKTYAVVGALFIPMLAAALLVLNGRAEWVGKANKNHVWTSLILIGILLFFLFAGFLSVQNKLLS